MLKVVPEVVEARTELARPGSDAVDVLVAVGGGGKEHEVGGMVTLYPLRVRPFR